MNTEENCTRPPSGWVCARNKDHEGSCAAWPVLLKTEPLETRQASMSALQSAVHALYFNDSSDYERALWSVVRSLDQVIHQQLQDDPRGAFKEVNARRDALAHETMARMAQPAPKSRSRWRQLREHMAQRLVG